MTHNSKCARIHIASLPLWLILYRNCKKKAMTMQRRQQSFFNVMFFCHLATCGQKSQTEMLIKFRISRTFLKIDIAHLHENWNWNVNLNNRQCSYDDFRIDFCWYMQSWPMIGYICTQCSLMSIFQVLIVNLKLLLHISHTSCIWTRVFFRRPTRSRDIWAGNCTRTFLILI